MGITLFGDPIISHSFVTLPPVVYPPLTKILPFFSFTAAKFTLGILRVALGYAIH